MSEPCPKCGQPGPHYFPPSMGEDGFYICDCARPTGAPAGGDVPALQPVQDMQEVLVDRKSAGDAGDAGAPARSDLLSEALRLYDAGGTIDEIAAALKVSEASVSAILRPALCARPTGAPANRPAVVCLCGSTRFKEAFDEANYRETMAGRIVLSVGFYMHASGNRHGDGVGCTPEQKVALDELHKRKIDLADEVFVLNVGGYIGESTRSEIEYARAHRKPVRYLEAEVLSSARPTGAPAGGVTPEGSRVVPAPPAAYRHASETTGLLPICSCGWRSERRSQYGYAYHDWLEHAVAAYQQEEARFADYVLVPREDARKLCADHHRACTCALCEEITRADYDDDADCDALAGDDVAGSEVQS